MLSSPGGKVNLQIKNIIQIENEIYFYIAKSQGMLYDCLVNAEKEV
jgi:hypothetical protein